MILPPTLVLLTLYPDELRLLWQQRGLDPGLVDMAALSRAKLGNRMVGHQLAGAQPEADRRDKEQRQDEGVASASAMI